MPARSLSLSIVLAACCAAAGDDLVPFVIPTDPSPDSLIAAGPSPAFRPGGQRIVVRDAHFFRGPKRHKVWGVNMCFGACFPSHPNARRTAARLAAVGVNSVRFHHMDSADFPRGIWQRGTGDTLSAEALDRLDYFIDQLAGRGITANINLHVSRSHSRKLGLPDPRTKYDKMVGIFTPRLIEAQKKYARDLLTHVNRYRKIRYADDPAIAFVEISNEDSLFMWGADRDLRNLPAYYAAILTKRYNDWLKRRYGSTARQIDRAQFLAETEKAYFDDMKHFIQKDLGCGALVTGTIVMGPLGLWAQSDMDFIDTHAYWHHPRFPGRPWDRSNWTIEQQAMADHPDRSPLFRLAASRLAGKPLTVSEYNHPAPNDHQAECVPLIATFAAAQDWDGVWLFTYRNGAGDVERGRFEGFFDMAANPAKWGFMRAGTAIFREGGVDALAKAVVVPLTDGKNAPGDLAALHARHDRDMLAVAAARGNITWKDLLKSRLYVTMRADAPKPPPAPPDGRTELTWAVHKGKGSFFAMSRRAAVTIGRPYELLRGPRFVVRAFAALDGKSLRDSGKILLTACGRCENTGMKFSKDRRTVGRNWGGPPVRIEPMTAAYPAQRRAGSAKSWKCYALGPDGKAAATVPAEKAREPYATVGRVFELSGKYGTMWYLLTRDAPAGGGN